MPQTNLFIKYFTSALRGNALILIILSFPYLKTLNLMFLFLLVNVVLLSYLSSNKVSLLWGASFLTITVRFITNSLIIFFVSFELSLVPILIMLLFWGRQPERLSARLYFLIYTSFFSFPFLVALILVIKQERFLKEKFHITSRITIFILLIPFLVKLPLIGIHFWLPKAHVEARTRGSILLAGVLLKLGRYGVFRIVSLFFFKMVNLGVIFIGMSLLSRVMTFINSDIKKIIAYRRVTHITFLMCGVLMGLTSLLFLVSIVSLTHGWRSSGLFSKAGQNSNLFYSRLGFFIGRDSKLRWPVFIGGVLIITNAAIPPMPSFFPEAFVIISLLIIRFLNIVTFILFRVIVCYYNVYLFILFSHFRITENTTVFYSLKERIIAYRFIILSVITTVFLTKF